MPMMHRRDATGPAFCSPSLGCPLNRSFLLTAQHCCFSAALPKLSCRRRVRVECSAVDVQRDNAPRRLGQFVTAEVGLLAQADAITHFRGDAQAVAERYAVSVAEALVEMYPLTGGPSAVFVVCGPGFNGLVGVRAAILLKRAGYSPTVFRPKSSSALADIDVDSQLEASGVSFCDFVPRTLDFYYDIVVDALLGMGFDGEDLRSEYWGIFEVLLNTQLPLVSVDMPTGWDLDNGPRVVDVRAGTFLQPELLVSLGVPKNGAKMFAGSFHYIGGRNTLPVGWMETHGIELPAFRSESSSCALLSSSALPSRSRNGEAYGRPGRFEATLWDPKTRITWVSDEEADDMDIFEYD